MLGSSGYRSFPGTLTPRSSNINVSFYLHSLQAQFICILDHRIVLKSFSANSNNLVSVSCLSFGELILFSYFLAYWIIFGALDIGSIIWRWRLCCIIMESVGLLFSLASLRLNLVCKNVSGKQFKSQLSSFVTIWTVWSLTHKYMVHR